MPILRRLWMIITFTLLLPFGFTLVIIQSILKLFFPKAIRSLSYRTLVIYIRLIFILNGLKVTVEGKENIPADKKCVFMSNHQDVMDILLIYGFLGEPMAMVAKKDLQFVPLVGNWLSHMDCYLLDRKDPRQAITLFQKASEEINQGYPALIYPEGTRSFGPKNGIFHQGSMRLPLMAGAPIVPITLNGSWKILHGAKLGFVPAPVKIVIGKPVNSADYGKARSNELSETVQHRVEEGFTIENEPNKKAKPFAAKYQ